MSTGFYILLSTVTVCSTAMLLISAFKLDRERKAAGSERPANIRKSEIGNRKFLGVLQ